MALHTRKEFAELCGLSSGNLSNYIGRKNVIATGDYIDDALDKNKAFLIKWQHKNGSKEPLAANEVVDTKRAYEKHKPATTPTKSENRAAKSTHQREIALEEADLEIKTQKARYEKIKADKAEGLVIPTDLVKMLFLQNGKSIFVESKNFLEDFIIQIAQKHGLTATESAEWRKKAIDGLNLSIKNSTIRTKEQLGNIVDEYSETKGVGERD